MKKTAVLFFIILLTNVIFLSAQNATEIMTSVRNQLDTETMRSRSRLVRTARDGRVTERVIDQFSKDGPHGSRVMIEFLHPADVAGTRFLTEDNASGNKDQRIFLNGRERRILADESSGSFMGTDFSYDDISSLDREVSLDTHTLLREETLNGVPCYVIQSIPKGPYQYSKSISWVDKNRFIVLKSEKYNQRNELVKIMEMSDYRDEQGFLTPRQTKISTVSAGTSTTIFLERVSYNLTLPDEIFSRGYLEFGMAYLDRLRSR